MSKRAVLYARLSIASDESVSIERQLQAGRDYCRARGWTVVAEYKDDGVSASVNSPEDRKGWQQVLAQGKGTFDVVLVWKVDRLARKVLDFLTADKALQERGAAVAAVEDPVDMSTPTGRAFATMLAVFAEMEAETIRSRVKAARATLIKNGRVAGGAAPFGYMNAPNPNGPGKVLAQDPETIGFVREACQRAIRGDSINSIASYLDEVAPRSGRQNAAARWTITVTKRMLSNPVLAGMTPHNPGNDSKARGSEVLRDRDGMPVVREELAVLSITEYRQLQVLLGKKQPKTAKTESYLSGLVWCGDCNRKMYRNAKTVHGKKVRVFQCQGRDGCGQQVTNLEAIVEDRFLAEFGNRIPRVLSEVAVATDHYETEEITRQINETMERMQDDDADVITLAERLQALRELRRSVPDVKYKVVPSTGTFAERWEEDPRAALLTRWDGVRIVKGGKGRKFDESRLSWIPRVHDHDANVAFFKSAAGQAIIKESKKDPNSGRRRINPRYGQTKDDTD